MYMTNEEWEQNNQDYLKESQGDNNRPTKSTTFAISGAMIITEMQHLSDFSKRKNSDTTRNGNDASYFHRKLGTLGSCSSMSFSVILSVGFK